MLIQLLSFSNQSASRFVPDNLTNHNHPSSKLSFVPYPARDKTSTSSSLTLLTPNGEERSNNGRTQ
jgi:hypothetical protein